MRILVTRPRQDAQPLAAELRERGHDVLVAPMLTIEAQAAPADIETTLAQAQAILVTSLNGMRRLSEITTRRDLTIAAVGESTAVSRARAAFATLPPPGEPRNSSRRWPARVSSRTEGHWSMSPAP